MARAVKAGFRLLEYLYYSQLLEGMNRPEQPRGWETAHSRPSRENSGCANDAAVPDHLLLALIASGAYGEVWLAANAVGTLRAVKIVRRDQHTSDESFEREFKGLQRFEPLSRSHEGLVDILTIGLLPDKEGFYYVMELADNLTAPTDRTSDPGLSRSASLPEIYSPRTLRADLKAQGALSAREVIALGIKLADAMSCLHSHGLVHRDIKPSNILFIGGEPKLADAGLVTAVDDARSLVGTAGYIAPEGPGTPQADIYALGKVLYETAFGKDRQEFPALPVDIASRHDHELLLEFNALLLKACATERSERYQSVDQLHADLNLLNRGGSVKRRHALLQVWKVVFNLGVACAALAFLVAVAYALLTERTRPAAFNPSPNPEANKEYREGVIALQVRNESIEAVRHFEAAIQKDPKFADAYARLAGAWISAGGGTNVSKARRAAEQALALDRNLAAAHCTLATVKLFELDWAGAEEERAVAVRLAPRSEVVLLESALNLAVMGNTNKAITLVEQARHSNADSVSNWGTVLYGCVYAWCRQYDRGIEIYNQFPQGGSFIHEQRAQAYLAKGDYTNAMRLEKLVAQERGEAPEQVDAEFSTLERAFEQGGPARYWEQKLAYEGKRQDEGHLMRMAAVYARLNKPELAFLYLKRAMKESPASFAGGIYTNPGFDNLRTDPQFALLEKELWKKGG